MKSIYKSPAGERAVKERYQAFLKYWPVPNEQLRVPTGAGETFVIASGQPNAPPLVLLHGSGFNSVSWMGDVATWAQNFRVYAVDIIGHPGFSAPTRPPYDSDGYAQWLDDVLTSLGPGKYTIVGISLGGRIATDFAIRRPDRVERLVLLCPGGIGREKISMLKLFLSILPLLAFGPLGRRKAMQMMLGGKALPDNRAARAVADFMSLISRHFRHNLAKVTRFEDAALKGITRPLLLIVGGRDAMIDSAETRNRVTSNIATAQIEYLPDAGHALFGYTNVVDTFLRGM
ncbi:MAG: alpha/beta fold hydrolase [Steroidobacteraceae bacterium]